jgi:hypothetical protein
MAQIRARHGVAAAIGGNVGGGQQRLEGKTIEAVDPDAKPPPLFRSASRRR